MTRLRHRLAALSADQKARWVASLTDEEKLWAAYDWQGIHARDSQLPPPEHASSGVAPEDAKWIWLVLTGRAWGKTRAQSEWLRMRREQGSRIMGLVGKAIEEVHHYGVEGPAGLLKICPPWDRPRFSRKGRGSLIWEPTDRYPWQTVCYLYSGQDTGQVRGLNADTCALDEFAKYPYPGKLLDVLEFAMRHPGAIPPRVMIGTTPVPTPDVRHLLEDPGVVVTRGSLFENKENLPEDFLRRMRQRWEGTTFGRQELHGELLTEQPGALWKLADLERHRGHLAQVTDAHPGLFDAGDPNATWKIWDPEINDYRPAARLVDLAIGVDPAGSTDPSSGAEIGIVVVGLGDDAHLYVLDDMTMPAGTSPAAWANQAIRAWIKWGQRGAGIVAEGNYGGRMVESTIRGASQGRAPVRIVTASRSKQARAQPVALLAEQGRMHMLGSWPALESQLTTWVPGNRDEDGMRRSGRRNSPDRLDAMAWAAWYLMYDREEWIWVD